MKTLVKSNSESTNGGANLGFECELWKAADVLRTNVDAAEYKYVLFWNEVSWILPVSQN